MITLILWFYYIKSLSHQTTYHTTSIPFVSSLTRERWPLEFEGRTACLELNLAPYFLARLFSLAFAVTISFSLKAIVVWKTTCSKQLKQLLL